MANEDNTNIQAEGALQFDERGIPVEGGSSNIASDLAVVATIAAIVPVAWNQGKKAAVAYGAKRIAEPFLVLSKLKDKFKGNLPSPTIRPDNPLYRMLPKDVKEANPGGIKASDIYSYVAGAPRGQIKDVKKTIDQIDDATGGIVSAGGKELKSEVMKPMGYSPKAGSKNIGIKSPEDLITKFTNIKDPIFKDVKLKDLAGSNVKFTPKNNPFKNQIAKREPVPTKGEFRDPKGFDKFKYEKPETVNRAPSYPAEGVRRGEFLDPTGRPFPDAITTRQPRNLPPGAVTKDRIPGDVTTIPGGRSTSSQSRRLDYENELSRQRGFDLSTNLNLKRFKDLDFEYGAVAQPRPLVSKEQANIIDRSMPAFGGGEINLMEAYDSRPREFEMREVPGSDPRKSDPNYNFDDVGRYVPSNVRRPSSQELQSPAMMQTEIDTLKATPKKDIQKAETWLNKFYPGTPQWGPKQIIDTLKIIK